MKTERNQLPSAEPVEAKELFPQFYGEAKDVVARYTHCPICGSNMHFHYITDFTRNIAHETARCLECAIKIRKILHQLH